MMLSDLNALLPCTNELRFSVPGKLKWAGQDDNAGCVQCLDWTQEGTTKMKDFARFKPMQRHLFLYEKAVVFCKRRVESGEGGDRYPSYSFKHCLKVRPFELYNVIVSRVCIYCIQICVLFQFRWLGFILYSHTFVYFFLNKIFVLNWSIIGL